MYLLAPCALVGFLLAQLVFDLASARWHHALFVAVNGDRWHSGRRDTRPNAARRVRETVRVGEVEHEMVVDATGFWQVHTGAPSLLATRVSELAGRGATALDLYSGAGLLTRGLADSFEAVLSIESDANAVRAARRRPPD